MCESVLRYLGQSCSPNPNEDILGKVLHVCGRPGYLGQVKPNPTSNSNRRPNHPQRKPKSAPHRPNIEPEMAQDRPRPSPKRVPESTQHRPPVGPSSARTRLKIEPKLAQNRPQIGAKSTQSRPPGRCWGGPALLGRPEGILGRSGGRPGSVLGASWADLLGMREHVKKTYANH